MENNKALVWIRDDFRVNHNSALAYASENHEQVSTVYIFNPEDYENKREAQRWWIYHSLINFKQELSKFNISLELLVGDEVQVLKKIKTADNVSLYWNKIPEPGEEKKETKIIKNFEEKNINYKFFKGNILSEHKEVTKDDGTPFKVFTPFWRVAEQVYLNKVPPKKSKTKKKNKKIFIFKQSSDLSKVLPNKKWFKKFEKYWTPSEIRSGKVLDELIEKKIGNYHKTRDYPSIEGTSKISPYLKHGQVHVEKIWESCQNIQNKNTGYRKFVNEIGWREFSHSLINYFPQMLKGNLRKEFDSFPWIENKKNLEAWKKGLTGYSIVDAGMRELYETGWIHNRVRMIVGSFLVKHLRIHWKEGEKYFRNTLLDFNVANNVASWQWVAGCGADAAPYFRIFNPILQGEKFDKDGTYVKHWVPELKNVPSKFIHRPWEMDDETQKSINIKIGKDYPLPIVDHAKAREQALKAFDKITK
jgi:deoxyribodipyrimidine photo-lyase